MSKYLISLSLDEEFIISTTETGYVFISHMPKSLPMLIDNAKRIETDNNKLVFSNTKDSYFYNFDKISVILDENNLKGVIRLENDLIIEIKFKIAMVL
jgi:hypothetical protein